VIASRLRDTGLDVVAVVERGWETETDEAVLAFCRDEERALLTNNVGDFVLTVRRWAAEGRSHSGLVFTSDESMPRSRHTIGRYVQALARLLRSLPANDALVDRVHLALRTAFSLAKAADRGSGVQGVTAPGARDKSWVADRHVFNGSGLVILSLLPSPGEAIRDRRCGEVASRRLLCPHEGDRRPGAQAVAVRDPARRRPRRARPGDPAGPATG